MQALLYSIRFISKRHSHVLDPQSKLLSFVHRPIQTSSKPHKLGPRLAEALLVTSLLSRDQHLPGHPRPNWVG